MPGISKPKRYTQSAEKSAKASQQFLIEKMEELTRRIKEADLDGANWAHAGSMAHLVELVNDVEENMTFLDM